MDWNCKCLVVFVPDDFLQKRGGYNRRSIIINNDFTEVVDNFGQRKVFPHLKTKT